MRNKTMKQLPESERPYEKCLRYGPQLLSDAELLAVIIRSGSKEESAVSLAQNILARFRYPEGILGLLRASIPELCEIKGIGAVKAVQLLCIGELSKRIARAGFGSQPMFTSPDPPLYFNALTVATKTTVSGFSPAFLHLISKNFSAPKSAPNPASVMV